MGYEEGTQPEPLSDVVGDAFQQLTKYDRHKMRGGRLDWSRQPETYKSYSAAKRTALPPPTDSGGPGLWGLTAARRSRRAFTSKPLSQADLSQLLWATQGITLRAQDYDFRAVPSAGALYPIESYIVAHRVEGMAPGVYHYDVRSHGLDLLTEGDCAGAITRAALDQPMAAEAAAVFVWTAVVERSKWKYRQRAYRYVYLDGGHIGQALALAAEALSLGCCAIGALYDDEVNALLGIDGENETVIYMTVVGHCE